MPLQMYVNPVVDGRDSCPTCTRSGRSSRRTRTRWTRRRSAGTATSGSRTGPTSWCDEVRPMSMRGVRIVCVVVPLGFFAVFFAWPLGDDPRPLARRGRARATRSATPSLRHVIWFTLWQAVLSTLLTLARRAARGVRRRALRRFRAGAPSARSSRCRSCCRPSSSRPRSSRCSGRAARSRSCTGSAASAPMLAAHVFFNLAVVVRTVGGFWANLDPRREEAARMLGAIAARRCSAT